MIAEGNGGKCPQTSFETTGIAYITDAVGWSVRGLRAVHTQYDCSDACRMQRRRRPHRVVSETEIGAPVGERRRRFCVECVLLVCMSWKAKVGKQAVGEAVVVDWRRRRRVQTPSPSRCERKLSVRRGFLFGGGARKRDVSLTARERERDDSLCA